MSLFAKSTVNLMFTRKCYSTKKLYNIAINRAYYSVFQRIKHYLISKNFNYRSFLISIDKEDEIDYSHRTLSRALKECLKNKDVDISSLVYIPALHRRRKQADYEDTMLEEADLENSYTEAMEIINLIQSLN